MQSTIKRTLFKATELGTISVIAKYIQTLFKQLLMIMITFVADFRME